MLDWLIDLQRSCGQQAPLIKHDRFVHLCHQATGSEPPHYALALDPIADGAPVHDSTEDPAAGEDSPPAQSWSQRAQQAAARLLLRRPRLSLIVLIATLMPATVWGSWRLFSDVNYYLSALVAGVVALAVARPLLRNLWWALAILLGPPLRAGVWLADTLDTDRSE